MDDEDGRCLLDVICDPEALNDFLHGSDKLDSDDLLDSTGDATSNYFVGPPGLHVQESAANHLNAEPSQPSASVDLDFLEDDILGSPTEGGTNISNSDQPCDILQQSLQEANITEQTLEAEAELDLGSFQLPTLQPVVQATSDAASQIFSSGADLIGLQQSAVLTQQALVQQPMGSDVVNKTISVQPFIQQVGLGNVTIQPISNIQALPNGSASGALGIGQIQVVGQQMMAINPPSQQIIAKPVQQTQVTTMPVSSYIAPAAPDQPQVTLNSAGLSPQSAGLVLQKGLPPATAALNGNPMFCSVSTSQGTQSLTVTPSLNSPLVQAPNMIIQRTPTPIQPKPVMQSKYFQITPKLPTPNSALTIQNEVTLHPQAQQQAQPQQQPQQQQPSPQQKTAPNVTFMAGKHGQNVVLSGFQQSIPANMFKQPQPQQPALGKSMSVHLLNQSGSIVIPAQHVSQTMIQGQNQFLLPGQLTGTSAVQIPQQLSVGGQILAASHPGGQTHIIASQGPGGQLIANHALPAQILTNQNLAGHLNLGQVLAAQNAHAAHILSTPILQSGQMGQSALFQMPVSLASSLTHQTQTSLASSTVSQTGQTVIQGVSLPNSVAMLNTTDNHGPAVTIQSAVTRTQSPSVVQPQPATSATNLLSSSSSDQPSVMTVQTAQQPPVPSQAPMCVQQQPSQLTAPSQPSPTLAPSPEKMILGQTGATTVISQDSMQMFMQQKEQNQQQQQQQFYQKSLNMQQEKVINQPTVLPQSLLLPSYSIATATVTTTSSVPASVIVSSSSSSVDPADQPSASQELPSTSNLAMVEHKGPNLIPQFSTGQSQQALVCQMPAGQQKLPGASPSHSLPHQPLGEGSQLQSVHLPQLQSPHQSRPPSQPQPVSRPPSQPHSRPPSQPQSLSRPPSEPVSRSCTPSQPPVQPLFVIQNQVSSSPHGSAQHSMRPSSQPQVQAPFQSPVSHSQTETLPQSQLASPTQMQLQVQLAPQFQTQTEAHAPVQPRPQPQALTSVESQHSQPSHFQLQFPAQSQVHTQTAQTLHLTPDQQRNLQLVSSNLQTYSAIQNPSPQQKMRERLQQVQHSIILHAKQVPSSQPSVSMSQFNSHPTTVFVSSQGQTATMTTVAQAQCHLQGSTTAQSPSIVQNDASPIHGKVQTHGGGAGGPPAQLATLLQQTSVLVKTSSAVSASANVDRLQHKAKMKQKYKPKSVAAFNPNYELNGATTRNLIVNCRSCGSSHEPKREKCLAFGFHFVPISPGSLVNTLIDSKLFIRQLNLQIYFKGVHLNQGEMSRKSLFNPPINSSLKIFEELVEKEARQLNSKDNYTNNLSEEETFLLKLLKGENCRVMKPDKGGGVVLMYNEEYDTYIHNILQDSEHYTVVSCNEINISYSKIKYYLSDHLLQGSINKKLFNFLHVENPRVPAIFGIPKVHKGINELKFRPIVARVGSITEPLAICVDSQLKKFINSVPHIKDSWDFLRRITKDKYDADTFLATIDVVDLFPSIPHEIGLEWFGEILCTETGLGSNTINLIMEFTETVLKNNFVYFNGDFYQRRKGVAMGAACAPYMLIVFFTTERGYPKLMVDNLAEEVMKYKDSKFFLGLGSMDETTHCDGRAEYGVALTRTFSTTSCKVEEIIKKYWPILKVNEDTEVHIPEYPSFVRRRGMNLKDMFEEKNDNTGKVVRSRRDNLNVVPADNTKSGVINSVSGLGKLQVVGKVMSPLLSGAAVQAQQQQVFDSSPGSLKRPMAQQHSKESCFLEHLRKHQGSVLHPDCRSSFSSFEDALQRLLPYHLYQGALPSHKDYKKVDEEFEMVSTQLLKRTQAMLNKYRLLLFEEARRLSPSAEMVMIDRMFIQEEKTALVLDKQLAKEKPDEYVSSSYKSPSLVSSSSATASNTSEVGHIAECVKIPHVQGAAQINPTKLVIKHSGGSPSISWTKQSSSLDVDEDALPSRNKPPIKTYEARSRIGLKLKIKQEAGLSKVVHNTALDPVHQPTTTTVIKTPDHPTMTTCAGHMNGTVDHVASSPALDRKAAPTTTYCRLPLRKTYRENVDAFVTDRLTDAGSVSVVRRIETIPSTISVKQDDGSRSVITTVKTEENPPGLTLKETSDENSKISFLKRSETCTLVSQDNFRAKTDDSTSGLMKELAEVEDEFYHGIVKQEPPDSSASELAWEVSLPPTKRRKSESLDVDNASFSSDSPQDDSLNEHLQSAIDSILNLQQPHTSGQNARTPASSCNSSSSPFSSPIHRTETYLAPNHNGGLGARTYNR
ncbi:BRD4-interacting chromatin-remodeling complex-associated protein [Protopterus annectens]|uniref:BRD4-interacting chromatin-remodeling complex-associated protein n=1 Tax=Protopterus annectens TaxID=7888 RepID=UPI001CFB51B9|nr:BRD4-interacting chromatin-remodeling complex-associated protein [Protopterus annectens]